jgi:D-galactarolactone cycloisomerase
LKIAALEVIPREAESALLRVALGDGTAGWGELQSAAVTTAIVEKMLAPLLLGNAFDGSYARIEAIWSLLHSALRNRGHAVGFGMDAIAGIDLALWDLAARMAGRPVCGLLGASNRSVAAYVAGEPSAALLEAGFRAFQINLDDPPPATLARIDRLRSEFGTLFDIAVHAQWRFDPDSAAAFGRELDARGALWFACPLAPEDAWKHAAVARRFRTPIALGECYRTYYELEAFFREGAMKILQPDIGRCGLTEGLRIARTAAKYGVSVIPRVSATPGPALAAGLHFAVIAECNLVEYRPGARIEMRGARYAVPQEPGLGIAASS